MTVQDIYQYINQIADFSTQESWDNSGFLVGDLKKMARRIGVSLDITREVVAAACEENIDLLVSHHPVIFRAQKSFCAGEPAYALAAAGISAICAHTNYDEAQGGITDALAEILGFSEAKMIDNAPELSALRICRLRESISSHALASHAKKALGAHAVRSTNTDRTLHTVALCGGAGASFWKDARAHGADALITGDCGYHDFLDAWEDGFTIIAAGHFHTEQPGVKKLKRRLEQAFPELEIRQMPQTCPILDN